MLRLVNINQGYYKSGIWQVKSKYGRSQVQVQQVAIQVKVQDEQLLESSPSPAKSDLNSSTAGLVAALT